MEALVDKNVIIDALTGREPFRETEPSRSK